MRGSDVIERVRSWLEWPAASTDRLQALADTGPLDGMLDLPSGEELHRLLERMVVPHHAAVEIELGISLVKEHREGWWLLERLYRQLTELDGAAIAPPWPAPEPTEDPLTRYFHLYVFIAGVSAVHRMNAARGIPADITWSTLGDVGLQVANYQTRNGWAGFDGAFWIWQHFRGAIFRLGRLQYNFWSVEFDPEDALGFRRGDRALGVHIPATGPLTPEACDDSLRRASEFFPRHFPEQPYRVATCGSWLLDEQLAEYLPSTTNIMRFQRRFNHVDGWSRPGDDDVVRFVFGHLPGSIDDLPQRTTLERAVVAHLRSGRHWQIRLGWLEV